MAELSFKQVEPAKALRIAKVKVLQSSLAFTRYFFKLRNKRKFAIAKHHRLITDALDKVLRGEITKLIINIAPRYGKTELAVKNFIANGLAINAAAKFIHLSYANDLALDNSEEVRDIVTSEEYQTLFPQVQIKAASKAKDKWYTTLGGGVLARAAGGQVTGFGAGRVDDEDLNEDDLVEFLSDIELKQQLFAGALIIDDPIKPDDADSEVVRNRINNRYDTTIKNRVNSRKTPIIIIMQRLHEKDLCGHLLEQEPGEWTVLSIPCIQEDEDGQEEALWPLKHTLSELYALKERNPIMFSRQYMQNPMPKEGFLYAGFKTFTDQPAPLLPVTKYRVRKSYTDTADTGKDFLCSIAYDETDVGLFVLDVIYTQEPMETTEPMTALQLTKFQVDHAKIESNNGGRGFARNVEAQIRGMRNLKTKVEWFHQSQNKEARIYTRSADVTNMVYFPNGWEKRWPIFHKHVIQHLAAGKNKNDDAPDTLTGMVEAIGENVGNGNWAKYAGAFG